MILVLLKWGKDVLSNKMKKITVEQSKLTVSTVPFFRGHPVYALHTNTHMYKHTQVIKPMY